jgi:hypothetical protein
MIEEVATLIPRDDENYASVDEAVVFRENHFLGNASVGTPNFTKIKTT